MNDHTSFPINKPVASVLVLHSWWGLTPFIKTFCERLSKEGYLSLAPDLYHGETANSIEMAKKLRSKMDRKKAFQQILDSANSLRALPEAQGRKLGIVGFSLGAFHALWLVEQSSFPINATVLFYGARGGEYAGTQSAFLGHFAEDDRYVAASGVKRLEKALKSLGKTVDFYTYPGTQHWFFENSRPEYNAQAADLAWTRTIEFLGKKLA